ncbi:hypothetical protein B0H19DRAFT_1124092 [Mycena capillaripes]|nr:hypothetical protein B0H19DRAFT_1124092 [Mycena capillaripes]
MMGDKKVRDIDDVTMLDNERGEARGDGMRKHHKEGEWTQDGRRGGEGLDGYKQTRMSEWMAREERLDGERRYGNPREKQTEPRGTARKKDRA